MSINAIISQKCSSIEGDTNLSTQRKEVILNEIQFWKKNTLLPAHYCDFLTALYSGGESEYEENEGNISNSILAKEKNKKRLFFSLILTLTFAIIVLLFTISTFGIIPILISLIFAFFLLVATLKLSRKKSVFVPILFISSALLILGLSFKIWLAYYPENPPILLGLVSANCLMWLVSGFFLKLHYFTLSGAVGIVLVVSFILFI
ncbi:MAG: hypothetical protein ACE3JQ_08185 [Paenisporosarcina sp.]